MDESLRKIIVRKSAYKHWRLCPKLYEYVWVLGHESGSSPEGQFGTMFHSGAEQFFMEVNQTKLVKSTNITDALKAFEEFNIDHPIVGPWFENFKQYEARRWVTCYENWHDTDKALRYWLPVVVELELFSEMTGTEMHIDRINRYDEHELMNVEYKTEKGWYIAQLREECAFYNIGINTSNMFSDPCQWIAVFNAQLNKAWMERITTRLLRRLLRLLTSCKESIRDKNFRYKPSYFCRYCPRLGICVEENFGDTESILQKPEVEQTNG